MTHPLQTILFGTFTPPPSSGKTIKHSIMGNTTRRHWPPMGQRANQLMDALTSHKWWSVAELSEYLHIPTTNINTILYRHSHKFGIMSIDDTSTGKRRKLYRIQPNVSS